MNLGFNEVYGLYGLNVVGSESVKLFFYYNDLIVYDI